MLPRTIKRRTTTSLKTKNNKNCQKIKLYGNPTTKELKKKHSPRPVGGVGWAAGRRELVARWWVSGGPGEAVAGRPGDPHLCVDNPGRTTGE